ncbi:MAG: hypothetical protein DDT32_02176 [Syntrophomonadaceae bacterium]|nr:hypothetical protein [Bacillota bacterium]
MNGRQAHRSHVGHIDEFAPRGWLRDPRMITHIEVRIAECKLGCARDAYRQNNIDLTRNLVEEAARLADAVDRHYDEIPQERFRREDVTRIRQQVKQLREECLR